MASKDPDRPNILLILTDDQGCWAMGCAGNAELQTPHLDRLARTGLRFENFFCASPVCSPARASLLTGRIPSAHGIHDWLRAGNMAGDSATDRPAVEYLRGMIGYTDVLAQHGYFCGISGKWHLGDSLRPQKSLSFWRVHSRGGGPYYGATMVQNNAVYTESRYVTDVITDHALDFLNAQQANDAPFYLSVHYTAPHSPWDRANHPAAIYDRYFNECAFRSLPQDPIHPCQVVGLITADGANRRVILSGYFAAVTAMDANVGRLLDRLDETGLRSNTLILFTSDNGMNMGHHGIYGKGNGTFPQNMYDTSVKVPMLMSRPGFVAQNQVRRELLSHYDVMPTLLAYTGSRMPQNALLPGRSFAELLRGKPLAEREAVVVGDEYGPVRMIRTREWKYIHRYLYGPHELYDLANDPDEQRNLIGEAQYRNRAAELYSSLGKWFDAYTDPSLDGRRERVTGVGQDGPTGIQADGRTGFSGEEPGMLRDL